MSTACEHVMLMRNRVPGTNAVLVRCLDCGHHWHDLISRPLPREMPLDPDLFDGHIGYGVAE